MPGFFSPGGGQVPGRTHFLDQLAPDALEELERGGRARLAELKNDAADVETQLEMIELARAERRRGGQM